MRLTRLDEYARAVIMKLDIIIQTTNLILQMEIKMSESMDNLVREVEESGTVVDSVIVLLEGIVERLNEAGTDSVLLDQLAANLDAKARALAEAAAAIPPVSSPPTP